MAVRMVTEVSGGAALGGAWGAVNPGHWVDLKFRGHQECFRVLAAQKNGGERRFLRAWFGRC